MDKSGFITRLSAEGAIEVRWELPAHDTGTPSGIYADHSERVWVADTHNHRVLLYDSSGQELVRFGALGTGEGEFLFPTDVITDAAGHIYVSEYGGNDRISKFTPDFVFVKAFGDRDSGLGELAAPGGMTLDGSGLLWVCDTGNHRVCAFDLEGRFIRAIGEVGSNPGQLKRPLDIAWLPGRSVREEGELCICENGSCRVQRFALGGLPIGAWGEPGRGVGKLSGPTGLAYGLEGVLLIADPRNGGLIRVSLSEL